ncbi:lantibiotic dehydratase [Streptomyces sp. NPDC127084]|uniref:lantibiotic dehydratase n=1 Tax=Streptomyces sp. NPDC127084 TaxID=3347133 RepID=UPI003655C449
MTHKKSEWALGDHFMLRVAGLPIDSIHSLRCPQVRGWAAAVLKGEDALQERGAYLSEHLHDIVASEEDPLRRRALLQLRRYIWNNRMPDARVVNDLTAGLNENTAAAITSWMHTRQQWQDLLDEGEEVLNKDVRAARRALRALSYEPRLRRGVQVASPLLEERLEGYAHADSQYLDKRQRRLERSLLEYVYRAACKTSPFSTFTAVVPGRFTEGADVPMRAAVPPCWRVHPRINVSVLTRIADLLLDIDNICRDLPMALASGCQTAVDRVRFVRRSISAAESNGTFDAVREHLFVLRNSALLERIVAQFEREPEVLWGNLVNRLAGDDAGVPEREAYARILRILLRLGLLQIPVLQIDVHTTDPLRTFSASLRSLGSPDVEPIYSLLDHVAILVDTFATAETAERVKILRKIRSELESVFSLLGAPVSTIPITLLFEDAHLADAEVVAGYEAWNGDIGEALRSLESVLPIFDAALPQRLMLKGFFIARFGRGGRCDDLLKLICEFNEDLFDHFAAVSAVRRTFDKDGNLIPNVNWLRMPEMEVLDRARAEFTEGVRGIYEIWDRTESEVVLDDCTISQVAEELQGLATKFAMRSHFLQPAHIDGEFRAVLNRTYGASLFPFTRFTHHLEATQSALVPMLRESLRSWTPTGAVFAEVTGGQITTNLNLHSRLTELEIVCPGETSFAPRQQRLSFDDLYVEHDESTDRLVLRSRASGNEVIPVYLGYLVPTALPEIPRTLLLLSPSSTVVMDIWGGVEARPSRAGGGVTVHPRVRLGDLVVARRSWTAQAADLPRRTPGMPEERWYLEWQRWRRAHRVPTVAFATITPHSEDDNASELWRRGTKPYPVDFDSPLNLSVLDHHIKTEAATVVFHEMLPAENALTVTSDSGRHVAEVVVETLTRT